LNQDFSNLLWAAWRVNRPQGDGRTARPNLDRIAFVAKAPLNLAYAVDFSKITGASDNDKDATAGATVGVSAQKRLFVLRLGRARHGVPRECAFRSGEVFAAAAWAAHPVCADGWLSEIIERTRCKPGMLGSGSFLSKGEP
jgi:hypothetical protein